MPVSTLPDPPAGPRAPVRRPERAAGGGAGASAHAGSEVRRLRAETAELRDRLAERTADLQRVKAEYDNFRKRTRRDRLAVRQVAVANVLRGLLPVLDAVESAREHGEVRGGFATVAEALGTELAALGLEAFGEPGDRFDPAVHEALAHRPSATAEEAVCAEVLRPGYRVGDQLLRPATVTVTGPPG
ncbi:GrpE protein [Streptantibioticus cattleyicolor NRRL 8057 = DSM 46488]|uniref:Protein GrpE n=1 Tax=Streptantibioticus cattleyicolor (strain ATCC 35852 / DSM 46488 / JCM 4925 / NBRC 14057 / NRRL 8057) TaxID=1003195 RepID=G8WVF2_STREN|nr:GrpE protein [Streptantibioticus cattleyicolor NRRL 8057 = DSM 46488]